MVSQTDEQALEAHIEKHLTGLFVKSKVAL